MTILAIDTSFDDTAVAVVDGRTILSNVLSTDLSLHLEYGGIVPRLARESHEQHIDAVISLALKRAKRSWNDIDRIAVTQGPGLAICLEVGIKKAKELAQLYKKPLIPVNHMEGHLLSFLAQPNQKMSVQKQTHFPVLGVLLSGGNTQFVYAQEIGSYEIVGRTKDDAMGEAYDKIGRMLGLGYPAGAFLENMAETGVAGKIIFPVPMRQIQTADLSFSGLKTAAMRIVESVKERNGGILSKQDIADIALGFQTAAITHLTEKLQRAIDLRAGNNIQGIVAGGGVINNKAVRKALREVGKRNGLFVRFPYSKKLNTDNAAMIGIAALHTKPTTENFDRKPVYTLDEIASSTVTE